MNLDAGIFDYIITTASAPSMVVVIFGVLAALFLIFVFIVPTFYLIIYY